MDLAKQTRADAAERSSYLFRNVTVWDGHDDAASPGEVLVEGNWPLCCMPSSELA